MSTSPQSARRIIVGSLATVGGLTYAYAVADPDDDTEPELRYALGALGAAVVLSMLADASPRIASLLAILVLVTAAINTIPTIVPRLRNLFGD